MKLKIEFALRRVEPTRLRSGYIVAKCVQNYKQGKLWITVRIASMGKIIYSMRMKAKKTPYKNVRIYEDTLYRLKRIALQERKTLVKWLDNLSKNYKVSK